MVELSQQIIYLIKDLGFPIAMVLYFAMINNNTIKKNTEALVALEKAILLKQ